MTGETAYCTILAKNYLPRALTLATSLRRHHPDRPLVVLLIDAAQDEDLPELPEVRCVSMSFLGLPDRAVLELAASYGLVELATSIKPLLLQRLLEESEHTVYLDPDTYVTSPMVELEVALEESTSGIVLTPHYLQPIPEHTDLSEGHMLTVGVYNLGFCAVDRRSKGFLDWWWGHLEYECLADLLSGLFVDQRWVDIGAVLFHASSLQHYGYNVGILNVQERPLDRDDAGYVVRSTGDRLRLFHFHAFDSSKPQELSTRFDDSSAHLREQSAVLDELCIEYADILRGYEQQLGEPPAYRFATDTRGRTLSRFTKRAIRNQLRSGDRSVPSPFLPEEAAAFDKWRRGARKQIASDLAGDAAKALRVALPEGSEWLQGRFPKLTRRLRSRYVDDTGIWG